MNNDINEEIVHAAPVPPFVRFVASAVPMVFDNSLSYYECLCALWKWMQDNLVDVINNNASVTEQYITLTNELKEFVENYFDNLDVQEEINNKLDEMAEDGTLEEMIASVLHLSHTYDTFDQFYADTENHQAGAIIRTLGHSTINDKRGATYKIVDSEPTTAYEALPNSLYALVINNDGIRRENTPNQNYFYLDSERLYGVNKSNRNLIEQTENDDCTIEAIYNECSIERLSLQNTNNYDNKTAIKVDTPSQRFYANSIFVRGGMSSNRYSVGLDIPTSYYSYFNDMFIVGETGVKIGQSDNQNAWTGVLDFNSCHINDCDLGVRQYAKDTNTICFDKCSFEGDLKGIENDGTVYFRNTYFGDNPTDLDTPINLATANAGSETYFSDCTLQISATDHADSTVHDDMFKLKSADGVGSKIFVKGGLINISNNNWVNASSAIYSSDSNLNEIYLDYVKCTPSTQNTHHNYFPYYLHEGYSPLRSLEPITNYVANGTMKSALGNSFVGVESSHSTMDANLVNPFGGKVASFTRSGTSDSGYSNFYFKIPKDMVGKPMTLEVYAQANIDKLDVYSPNLGRNYTQTSLNDKKLTTRDNKRVGLWRLNVTPSAESGIIQILLHWSDSTDGAWYMLSGVVLKEAKYEKYLSCYKDIDMLFSKVIPTDTTNAVKGDIVYASPDSAANCLGWIYNGTSWTVLHSYA